jgi:hypothetical protein
MRGPPGARAAASRSHGRAGHRQQRTRLRPAPDRAGERSSQAQPSGARHPGRSAPRAGSPANASRSRGRPRPCCGRSGGSRGSAGSGCPATGLRRRRSARPHRPHAADAGAGSSRPSAEHPRPLQREAKGQQSASATQLRRSAARRNRRLATWSVRETTHLAPERPPIRPPVERARLATEDSYSTKEER